MGISDWIGGTKCSECRQKIQGQRISRTVMGTSVWICGSCNQKHIAERQKELEFSRAAEQERKKERDAADAKRTIEAATAIQQRRDEEIAEAMAMIVLKEFAAFHAGALAASGEPLRVQNATAFMFVLAASTQGFRALLRGTIDSVRLDRIEALAVRYALGLFIHGLLRNPDQLHSSPYSRQEVLAGLIEDYRKISVVHFQNISKLAGSGAETLTVYFIGLCRSWFEKDFAEAFTNQKGKAVRFIQFAGQVLQRAMSAGSHLEPRVAQIATPVNKEIEFELPEFWQLRRRDPYRYYDAGMPHYALVVSVGSPQPTAETPTAFLQQLLAMAAPETEPVSLTSDRAFAHYRSELPENGLPKEDHHFVLVEKRGDDARHALFTFSVVAARADRPAADALVGFFEEKIRQARFLV